MPYTNRLDSEEFSKYIDGVLENFHCPGMAIAVVHGDETYCKGFGYTRLGPPQGTSQKKTPVTPRTLFFAGSTTKSFTAAAAAKVVYSERLEHKDIAWSTPVSSLIPTDFVLRDEYAEKHITLTDALSHRTGMPRHDLSWLNGNPSVREQVRRIRHLPLHRELRVEWEYCNLMFVAVSHVLETVTGKETAQVFKEWSFEPLGMHETVYSLENALLLEKEKVKEGVELARGHLWDESKNQFVETPWGDIPPPHGSGGIISNVLDYTKWIRAFLHPSDDGPITESIAKDLTRAHMPIPTQPWQKYDFYAYGLGLDMMEYRGRKVVGHRGAIAGYMAAMYWIAELDWGFVIFQNAYSLAANVVMFRLIDDFLDTLVSEGRALAGRFDAASEMKKLEREAREKIEKGKDGVFPPDAGSAKEQEVLKPSLPLENYKGLYRHPAYQNIRITLPTTPQDEPELRLIGTPAGSLENPDASSLALTWAFHHVSSEHWWVLQKDGDGVGYILTDALLKAEFKVGVDGKVTALGLQVETAMEELMWFEKVD